MENEILNITLKKGAANAQPSLELSPITGEPFIFKGDEGNPFLAPRGVFIIKNHLFVTDTGRNSGKKVSASTLHYPSGIWSDGEKLIVADAWNHRVLIWHSIPTENGQAADVVIGQPDFESNEPNAKGIGVNPRAQPIHQADVLRQSFL
jgi:hypothetical protein